MAIRKHHVARKPKREVELDGRWYKVKSNKVDIPNLSEMPRISALLWLCRNTYPTGYSRRPNPLAGFAGALSVSED